jgi:hypothetical protein
MIVINNHYVDLKVCSKEEITILNKCKICPQNKLGYECTFFINLVFSAHSRMHSWNTRRM